jgi:hypothetical protein
VGNVQNILTYNISSSPIEFKKGEVRVKWCPTKDMLADFLTKPLQGAMFKRFRDLIMGALLMREVYKVLTRDSVSETDRKSLMHES